MFIPQMRAGKEKLVPVSVFGDDHIIYITRENVFNSIKSTASTDHIIYITRENFKMYEKGLTDAEGFELRKVYFR